MKPLYVKKNGTVNKVSGVAMPNTYPANRVGYDNTESELEATNTQDAIDEVVDIVADKVDKVIGKGLSANDYTDTDKAKVGKIDETTTSATGNPISITGLKSNQLAKDPVITFEPIQAGSGDPSPSNVRAISGYDKIEVLSCGVNIWDEEWEVGSIDYSTGEPIAYPNEIRTKDFISIIPSATYFIYKESGENSQYYFYDQNKHFIGSDIYDSNTVLSVPSNAHFMKFRCGDAYGTSYKNDISINYPSSINIYQPCNKTTDLSESIGQTVYGGSLDVRTGKLTVTKIKKILNGGSSESWVVGSVGTSGKYIHRLTGFTNDIPATERVVCNEFYGIAYSERNFENNNICWLDPDDNYVNVVSSSYTDVTSWQNFLSSNPLELCYSVSPFTIQLTPHEISLLKDYAYVSTNGTNISFSYKNGEMASLGDVAQLGQTVNELGKVTDITNQVTWDTTYLNIDTVRSSVIRTGNVVQIIVWGTWKGAYQGMNVDLITNLPRCKAYLNPYLAPCIPNMYSGDTRSNTYCEIIGGTIFRIILEEATTVQDKLFIGTFIYICE